MMIGRRFGVKERLLNACHCDPRQFILVFVFILSSGCAPVESATPILPAAPTATTLPRLAPSATTAPTLTLAPPTPTRLLPTHTPTPPVDAMAGLIAYGSDQDGDFEIWVMNSDGSDPRRLTDNQAQDGFPAWSPDGEEIAFMSRQDGNYEIYTMNADGSNPQRVTEDTSEDSDPSWSPDGEWLVFVSQRGGNDEIYLIKADGSDTRQLTDNGARNWSPAWQSSGATIARPGTWVRRFEGENYGAFFDVTLTPDGNLLTVGSTNHLHRPPYSGDALFMKLIYGFAESARGGRDEYAIRLSQAGELLWVYSVGNPGEELVLDALETPEGELVLAVGVEEDGKLVKLAADGSLKWAHRYELPGWQYASQVAQTGGGDSSWPVSR